MTILRMEVDLGDGDPRALRQRLFELQPALQAGLDKVLGEGLPSPDEVFWNHTGFSVMSGHTVWDAP